MAGYLVRKLPNQVHRQCRQSSVNDQRSTWVQYYCNEHMRKKFIAQMGGGIVGEESLGLLVTEVVYQTR